MSIALVAHTSAGDPTGSSGVTTGAIDTTGADFLIVAASVSSSSSTVSDNKSNTWHGLTAQAGLFGGYVRLLYAYNATVGSGHTFACTDNGASICVAVFSGADTSSPFVGENGAGFGAPVNTGSVTISTNGCLVVTMGAVYDGSGAHATVDANFSLLDFVNGSGGVHWDGTLAYEIQATATNRSATWTPSNDRVAAAIAAFLPSGGGGGGDQPMMRRWGGRSGPIPGIGQSSGGGKAWG